MAEYKLSGNRTIRTERVPTLVSDWLDEGKWLYGTDVNAWKFKCPMCGKIYSVQEFIAAGGRNGANGAYQECIGRYLGAGSPGQDDGNPNGCNWAAFGFLGTCGKGRLVQASDGDIVEVFHYADGGDGHGL